MLAPVPEPVTLKLVFAFSQIVLLDGLALIAGKELTVSVAALDVTVATSHPVPITQRY